MTVQPPTTSAHHSDDTREQPIVVAVRDPATGGPPSRWAARRATLLDCPLALLHAVPDPELVPPGIPYESLVTAAGEMLDDEAARIRADFPGVRLRTLVHRGDVVAALLGLAAGSPLLVVGADRSNPHTGEFEGSVGLQVALGSAAPVVVVPRGYGAAPTDEEAHGDVVVGIEGSALSLAALKRAAGEADRTGASLTVVVAGSTEQGDALEAATSTLLADVRARFPGLVIDWYVDTERPPALALAHRGTGAELLVIGRHGRGAREGMSLGSVTHALLLDPPCPTLVVTQRPIDQQLG